MATKSGFKGRNQVMMAKRACQVCLAANGMVSGPFGRDDIPDSNTRGDVESTTIETPSI